MGNSRFSLVIIRQSKEFSRAYVDLNVSENRVREVPDPNTRKHRYKMGIFRVGPGLFYENRRFRHHTILAADTISMHALTVGVSFF